VDREPSAASDDSYVVVSHSPDTAVKSVAPATPAPATSSPVSPEAATPASATSEQAVPAAVNPAQQVQRSEELRQQGNNMFKQNQLQQALKLWKDAAHLNPEDARIHNNMSLVLRSMGELPGALQAAMLAVKLADSSPPEVASKSYRRRAEAHKALGDDVAAARDYERCKALNQACSDSVAETAAPVQSQASLQAASTGAQAAEPAKTQACAPGDSERSLLPSETSYVHVDGASDSPPGARLVSELPYTDSESSSGQTVRRYHVQVAESAAERQATSVAVPAAADVPGSEARASPERQASLSGAGADLQQAAQQGAKVSTTSAPPQSNRHRVVSEAIAANAKQQTAADKPPPRTVRDLKAAYRSLQTNPQEAAKYLASVPPAQYRAIIKAELDPEVIDAFAMVLEAYVGTDQAWCKRCWTALSGVDRFSITRGMVKKNTKDALAKVEAALS
jgi:Potential Monad-binding region of RPAP3